MKNRNNFVRLLLFFDLPVDTQVGRKNYRKFIKYLTTEGYIRLQYSVYSKLCINTDSADTASKKVMANAPKPGDIRYIVITEKQYQKISNINSTYSLQEKITNDNRVIVIGDMNDESEK